MRMKRFFAILLSAILLLPLCFAAIPQGTHADAIDDIWAAISAYEDARFSEQKINAKSATERDYAALSDGVMKLVENWNGFVPGSINRHGDFFFWDGTDGVGYGYSPRLRERLRGENATGADPKACSSIETVSYAAKGGSPACGDVAVFGPYYGLDSSFSDQYKNEGNSIARAVSSICTVYETEDATIDNIANALSHCGVVIFDSHGDTDFASGNDYTSSANTSYLCLQSGTGITSDDMKYVQGTYDRYKHAYYAGAGYGGMKYYCVDGTAIKNHMNVAAPNSLLWMAICLGMATDGMEAPLRTMGVEVVYGYSQSVTFKGDYQWENYFWTKMKNNSDVQTAIAYMKEKVGVKDPYESSYPAYPIVVSSEDVYPGQGNVDAVQTVYSAWTLFPQFTVTAVANDTSLGTVSVSGTTVTAVPNTGCAVEGCEVISGTATVTQSGDGLSETRFSVRAESDCTVRINFAERTPASVTFVTPNGVSCDTIHGYLYDTVTFPTPSGTPSADAQSYRFYGWTDARTADTDVRPDCYKAGSTLRLLSDCTFYALYSYASNNGEPVPEGTYMLLVSEPADWSGDAVLTYNGSVVLSANSSANKIGTSSAAIAIESTGITVAGDLFSDVGSTYLYEIKSVGNGRYTIRMKGSSSPCYLCYNTSGDKLSVTKTVIVSGGKSTAHWILSFENGHPIFTNDQNAAATLCYDTKNQCFTCKKNNTGEPLTVYTLSDSLLMYTTELCDKVTASLYGDVNCSGSVTAADASALLRYLVRKETLSAENLANADVDGNGKPEAADAALILRSVVGLIDRFPAEE